MESEEQRKLDISDDFEREMDQELESKLREAETSCGIRAPDRIGKVKEDFWDSDEDNYMDEWEKPSSSSKKSKKEQDQEKVNDDLFYDPNMDDEDQKWVEDVRKDYNEGRFNQTEKPLPNSDAVLNCPACFVLLSLDCQQHESYEHQFRAMFVMNCSVDFSKQLKYPKVKGKGKKSKNKEPIIDPDDLFYAVKCDKCSTQVAVFDTEEIYHFFNVLASH